MVDDIRLNQYDVCLDSPVNEDGADEDDGFAHLPMKMWSTVMEKESKSVLKRRSRLKVNLTRKKYVY